MEKDVLVVAKILIEINVGIGNISTGNKITNDLSILQLITSGNLAKLNVSSPNVDIGNEFENQVTSLL